MRAHLSLASSRCSFVVVGSVIAAAAATAGAAAGCAPDGATTASAPEHAVLHRERSGEAGAEGEGEGEACASVDDCVVLPAAPRLGAFAWQGVQRSVTAQSVSGGGPPTACDDAGVVLGLWDHAVCYVGSDDELYCAGRVGDVVVGPSFTAMHQRGVRQLLGSATFNFEGGSAVCAVRRDATAWCLGYSPDGGELDANAGIYWGQFRTADGSEPGDRWTQWGSRTDVAELATGTMDQICARYLDGTADCTAFVCGRAGEPQACPSYSAAAAREIVSLGSGVTSLFVDTSGLVHVNDPTVFRASANRSECTVGADGLACGFSVRTPSGLAGHVVDGGYAAMDVPCWLTDDGQVGCSAGGVGLDVTLFEGQTALAIGVSLYGPPIDGGRPLTICAAMSDGSLWCMGANDTGRLGSGGTDDLVEPTEVAPPGSVRVSCPVLPQ